MNIITPLFLLTCIYLSIVFLHIAKKNYSVAIAYGLQSLAIVLLLVISYIETSSVTFLIIAFLGLIIKVILAPAFIIRLIGKHQLKYLVSTYTNMPLTLIIVATLTALAHSKLFEPLVLILPKNHELLSLALSALFISLFLLINRKGATSQIVGVLSLENSIVAFGLFSVVDQSLILEIGIIFSISVWIIIATVFISMIYTHFGSLDVTEMKHLKE
jgi:hydrogenase-4 membrane subunit HyfE